MILPDAEQRHRDGFKRQVEEGERLFGAAVAVRPLTADGEFALEISGPPGTSLAPLRAFASFVFRPSSPVATGAPVEMGAGGGLFSRPTSLPQNTGSVWHAPHPNYSQQQQQQKDEAVWAFGGGGTNAGNGGAGNGDGTDPEYFFDTPTTLTAMRRDTLGGAVAPPPGASNGFGLPSVDRNMGTDTPTTTATMHTPYCRGPIAQQHIHEGFGSAAVVGGGANSLRLHPTPIHLGGTTLVQNPLLPSVQQQQQQQQRHNVPHYHTLPPIHLTAAGEVAGPAGPNGGGGGGYGSHGIPPAQRAESLYERFMAIPAHFVPRLIGGGGKCILEFQNRSGAALKYDRTTSAEGMKTVRIRGNERQVDAAVELLVNKLASWVARDVGGPDRRTFWVPDAMVNQIIGKKGAKISDFQLKSGASVCVDCRESARVGLVREITQSLWMGVRDTEDAAEHLQRIQGNRMPPTPFPASLDVSTFVRRVVLTGTTANLDRCRGLLSDCVCKVLRLAAQHAPAGTHTGQTHPHAFAQTQGVAPTTDTPPPYFAGGVTGGPGGPVHSQTPLHGPAGVPHPVQQGSPWTGGAATGTGGAPPLHLPNAGGAHVSPVAPPPYASPPPGFEF
uniref:K Homology domain-containing protein n=1 Tax=Chromera velia CCMP2878 TaxID=1169474 RepID=A0A0G4HQY9_9ALVE|eukprot:Cvel_8013.t1-p1 / transcript=Cvel_8013.t1 / gene=Cvel_8013 / organism=Chromera_velia_CCMP2878 / gene_product=hypothetical protein / transcript_product=hypothetical protein / location=Cvel_scaffold432:82430-84710(+) / protein_length=613 / sequence_SO=supercontig / SO=protein_coding / is_pseudo=false